MIDLTPNSEAHRFIRAATTIVAGIYPLSYGGAEGYEESVGHARCIETCRVLVDALKHFDLPAKLMPVDILVMNPPAFALQHQGVHVNDWPDEAWSVAVMDDPSAKPKNDKRTGGWDGHMLVRVAREWMCDPNSGQFRRPGKIAMPGSWTIEYPKDQWNANRQGWALQGVVTTDTPSPEHPQFPLIQLRQRPDNTAWRNGTAATIDLDFLIEAAIDNLEALRKGTHSGFLEVSTFTGKVNLDLSQVVRRYKGEE